MTDGEKILIALREKPLKAFENHEACEHKASGLPIALLQMRDGGAVKFDIHKGHWLNVVQVSRRISASLRTRAIPIKKCLRPNRLALQAMTCSPSRSCQIQLPGMVTN
jgi:hypothetical protein